MGLNKFVAKEPRALPIFILADVSGSMIGEKINELNLALREMVSSLSNVDDIRGSFQLSVISFGTEVEVVQQLERLDNLRIPELEARGRTSMGKAFELVTEMIEDKEIVSSRSYAPTIVLISDGLPTDCPEAIYKSRDFQSWDALVKIQNDGRVSKSQRLALGIGEDADINMLKAFVNNPEIPVIKSRDASGIAGFFKWVTMSTVARMNSVNPNITSTVAPLFDIDDEDIII
ncbi:vWA domain-containing protein [Hornefia butyriciproducens]|uniref:vWA domain-containing protein n=1 Tax=Hornefia butyriciproducens TaxID=2652293 RepID=UPI003F8A8DB5